MLVIDFETRSDVDLTKTNAWTYSEHPSTEVICLSWADVWKDEATEMHSWVGPDFWPGPELSTTDPWLYWYTGGSIPLALGKALAEGDLVHAHNVAFEISIWRNIMVQRFGWPDIPNRQWRDTQATANYLALPPGLDKLSEVLNLGSKDPRGKQLISKYSKLHLKSAKWDIPAEDVRAFTEYCEKDVDQECKVDEWMGELPEQEVENFLEDLDMNLRGIRLDLPRIRHAIVIVQSRQAELARTFRELTGLNPTQREKVKEWLLNSHTVKLENMQGETIEEALEGGVTKEAAQALRIYLAFSKTSTSKLDAMLRNASADGRARFQTRYHGAATGRNTGAGIQPLNLPHTYEEHDPEQVVRDISYRDAEFLDAVYGDATTAVSKALRHFIIPDEGSRFIAADFVSVEAVILAVLSGEKWKIEAFKNKEPIYERTADLVFQLPPGTVTKDTHPVERFTGKTCELACGYQGSVGAWRKFDSSDRFDDDEVRSIVSKWRINHPKIVNFWNDIDNKFFHVVQNGGEEKVGEFIRVGKAGSFAYMEAPNRKRIWYANPSVAMAMPGWHNESEDEACALGVCDCKPILQARYMSWKAGGWRSTYTYGGKLTENACQFVSRELLREAQTRVTKAGFDVVLSIYDELLTEMPFGVGSVSELVSIMEQPVSWAPGWPVRADGWEGRRYKK